MHKLLTIDDEPQFTDLIMNYFGPRGFNVFAASTGEDGLVLALKERPEVCLIDLKMPGLHGDDVLREILQNDPNAKCIMITASEGEGKTRSKLLEMGAYACFDKPLTSLRDLEQTINRALEQSSSS